MNKPAHLPNDPQQAVETMLKITEDLVSLIESETNAVATNDGTTMAMNEPLKETVIDVYKEAADEFHNRLAEFRNVDKTLIGQLTEAQNSLKQTTDNNLKLLDKLNSEQE